MTVRAQGSRAWLLTDSPGSRRQARLGSAYRRWLRFRSNKLALAGLLTLFLLILAFTAAPLIGTCDPTMPDLSHRLQAPSSAHWLGQDELGRDLYSRLIYGGRVTLGMVVAVVLLVAPLGLVVGTVAGYAGGVMDRILMRATDVFLGFPRLVLALAFVAALRPGLTSAVLAISLTAWPPFALIARSETKVIRHSDYIAAVRLSGASPLRIILFQVFPVCVSSFIVRVALDMSGIIMTVAGLGFLGMGVKPPMAEWGTMIATSREYIIAQWWVPAVPGVAILVTSLAFNLVADGLRDVLDPKQE